MISGHPQATHSPVPRRSGLDFDEPAQPVRWLNQTGCARLHLVPLLPLGIGFGPEVRHDLLAQDLDPVRLTVSPCPGALCAASRRALGRAWPLSLRSPHYVRQRALARAFGLAVLRLARKAASATGTASARALRVRSVMPAHVDRLCRASWSAKAAS